MYTIRPLYIHEKTYTEELCAFYVVWEGIIDYDVQSRQIRRLGLNPISNSVNLFHSRSWVDTIIRIAIQVALCYIRVF